MKHIISIEEEQIIYLAGRQTSAGLRLSQYACAPLGRLSQGAEDLSAALGELSRNCGLSKKNAVIVLPMQGVLFRELYLPPIQKEKQLSASILNEMLYYHSNIGEYTVTYLESGHTSEEGQRGYFTYAVRNAVLEEVRQALDKEKIGHQEITIMPDCLARLTALCHPNSGPAILVDLHENYMELCLLENDCCVLSRRIGLKYETFADNLAVFAAEIADQVSRISQFQRTRHSVNDLHHLLLMGSIPELARVLPLLQAELDAIRPSELECDLFDFDAHISFDHPEMRSDRCPPRAAGALLSRR